MVRAHQGLSLRWVIACTLIFSGGVQAADLAVVIDDVGYNKARGMRAINLPGRVTLAVLPFAPHTKTLLPSAANSPHDVIIHQPMQPQPSAHARCEADTLTLDMPPNEFHALLQRADRAVPIRLGVSNHTGSLLTAHYQPMLQLMTHLRQRGLFFLDSRTTAQTVAMRAADEIGVIALQRDVFLDNVRTKQQIHARFEQAVALARQRGTAILVGHPYPESLSYLEVKLANLPGGIRLVALSELANQRRAALAQQPHPATPRISLGQ